MMRDISEIIVHHSATKDSGTVSWQAIRRYHIETNGWSDIGYHFGVELVNEQYEALVGRPLIQAGAHTVGHNEKSIGICFVGDYDATPLPDAMLLKGAQLIAGLLFVCNLTTDALHKHCEFANKTCAGNNFDLQELKKAVQSYYARYR
jgi:hypothetical protein